MPGDDTTFAVISSGTVLEVRPVTGPALLRIVGTLVEPPDAPATFSGNITIDGATTRHADVLYDSVFTFELSADGVCARPPGRAPRCDPNATSQSLTWGGPPSRSPTGCRPSGPPTSSGISHGRGPPHALPARSYACSPVRQPGYPPWAGHWSAQGAAAS